jgi:hypothetical protein
MTIAENIRTIKARIGQAARRAGKDPSSIKLVAVTKNTTPEQIIEAVKAGITDIGENRIQDAEKRLETVRDLHLTRHMIGHLQTNKVKKALEMFSVIQSVDSERLALEISNKAEKDVDIFIEVNTSGEESKFGVDPGKAEELARYVSGLKRLKLKGLMTIGPLNGDDEAVRESFRTLKRLYERIKGLNLPGGELEYLSMGMSRDFEAAIEEGSNLVRIGTAIFQ